VFEETGGRLALIGIVTAVNGLERAVGCGATTSVTVLVQHLPWIFDTAMLLGSSLAK
jgi:hypothetical protein